MPGEFIVLNYDKAKKIFLHKMSVHKIFNIFDIRYNNLSLQSALSIVINSLGTGKKTTLYFLNADCLYKTHKNKEYTNILNSADFVLPDGIGLRIITRVFGGRMVEDCNGTDFSPLLMQKAAEKGYRIFFLGSKAGVSQRAAENIRKQIPGIEIVGAHHGFFNDAEEVIKKINDSGADILFVAMGVPRQEKWIAEHREELNPRLCLGVGALFDYLSGRIPRASIFMRTIHLEWLWRICVEPRRMLKRYIIDGTKLFCLVLKQKFSSPQL